MKLLHQGNHELRLSHRNNLDFPLHLQNAIEVVVMTSGQSTAICGSKRYLLSEGDLFVAFPNQVHGFENSGRSTGYVLIVPVSPNLSAYHALLEQKVPAEPVIRKEALTDSNLVTLMEMACQEWNHASKNLQQGYVLILTDKLLSLLTLTDAQPVSGDALQSVLRFLNDHYREPLTRRSIARAVGYNESHLSHVFSQALDTTLTDYIISLRLNDALSLLTDTDLSVSQIALQLGFGSIRSFNRCFRQNMQLSPTAYRAAARQSAPAASLAI